MNFARIVEAYLNTRWKQIWYFGDCRGKMGERMKFLTEPELRNEREKATCFF